MEIETNSPKPGDTFFVRMNNGIIRELLFLFFIRYHLELFLDAAEILETRTVDGTDQQEYFVHYLNCKLR
jgi:hypothetical protein